MLLTRPCWTNFHELCALCTLKGRDLRKEFTYTRTIMMGRKQGTRLVVRASKEEEKRTFLTLEEAGLVELSGLSSHERFLCRLTISSLNLLRVISEQEGCPIEELNAGKVCDWFMKDKLKGEQHPESAVLQWGEDSGFQA